jgi:hypothetical protein
MLGASLAARTYAIHIHSKGSFLTYARRLSVQQVMQDIERAQLKGDVGEEELKALEIDVTGKIMLASWRGTRFEVVQVLREVVDNVLKDHSANDQELYHRARGLLLLGAIFKSTVPDESDEERRELERCVLLPAFHSFF